jgi:hypothetical protein
MSGYSGLLGCLIGSFLIIFFIVARFLFKIYRLFHQVKKNAEQQFDKQKDYDNDTKGSFYHRRTNNNKSETVVDSRNTDNSQKKIFSDDEGEYVDFEEEK